MKLSPCPFCNSADLQVVHSGRKVFPGKWGWVECKECLTTGPRVDTDQEGTWMGAASAVWNFREGPGGP